MADSNALFRFGPFRLDAADRSLHRDGEPVALTPKAFDLLLFLLRQSGRLVTKERLLSAVWPDVIVEEANVNKTVFLVREALGPRPGGGEWIVTVPRSGYRFDAPAEAPSTPAVATGATPAALPVVAVLPFFDGSPEADQGWLCAGIGDEIQSALASSGVVRVAARASAANCQRRGLDVAAIGSELGVGFVLEGSVRKDKARSRISVRLSQCNDGIEVWSAAYDRSPHEALAMQEEVARAVAVAIAPTVRAAATQAAPTPRRVPANMVAWQHWLQGRFHMARRPGPAVLRAVECFEKALSADPTFAPAHAALAMVWATAGAWESSNADPATARHRAEEHMAAARAIDPRVPAIDTAAGYVQLHYDWNAAAAVDTLEHVIARDAHDGDAHHWLAHAFIVQGRFDLAMRAGQRALAADPLNPLLRSHMAWHHLLEGDPAAAHDAAMRATRVDSQLPWGPYFAGWALAIDGRAAAAVRELTQAAAIGDGSPAMLAGLAMAKAYAGDAAGARKQIEDVRRDRPNAFAYETALVHLALHEHDLALRELAAAVTQRSTWIPYLPRDGRWSALRHTPEFARALAAIGGTTG